MRKLVSILLTVAGVILLVFVLSKVFDFKIPGFRSKIVNWNTSLQLEEILEINELITAEYHGETICTDQLNAIVTENEKYKSNELKKFEIIYSKIKNSLEQIIKDEGFEGMEGNEVKIERVFKSSYVSSIRTNADKKYYDQLVNFLSGARKQLTDALRNVYENSWRQTYDNQVVKPQLEKSIDNNISRYKEKLVKKLSIAYLGRGVVISGFEINDSLKNKSQTDTSFIKLKGEIKLFQTIANPWLVPGKVEGFETLMLKNKKPDVSKIIKVKINCEEQLRNEAIGNGVKFKALENAENLLNELYKGNEQIVLIDNNFFDLKYEAISIDGFFSEIEFKDFVTFLEKWSNEKEFDQGRYKSYQEQKNKLEEMKTKIKELTISRKLINNEKYIQIFEKDSISIHDL